MQFRANTPRVVDETIDGETLIIDMVTGSYFSCIGASSLAWTALTRGASIDATARAISASFEVDDATAAQDAQRFVDALRAEELLVEAGSGTAAVDAPAATGPSAPYEALRVEKHTDLADLILLDPVHDVSAAGWPSGRE